MSKVLTAQCFILDSAELVTTGLGMSLHSRCTTSWITGTMQSCSQALKNKSVPFKRQTAGWGLRMRLQTKTGDRRSGYLLEVLGLGGGVALKASVVLLRSVSIATLSLISRLQLQRKKHQR